MNIDNKLQELGIELPEPVKAVGNYIPALIFDKLISVSGQIPIKDGQVMFSGKVPEQISLESSQEAAKLCIINAIAQMKAVAGSLDNIDRIIKIDVFVNSSAGFTDQALVANGASALLVELFGENGRHTRAAVGVAELPLNSAVEISVLASLK